MSFFRTILKKIPEESRQNYEQGHSAYSTYQFGGIVRTYRQKEHLVEIEVKNQITVGDTVEFISPPRRLAQEIRTMYDLSGNPISVAHGGGPNVLISTERDIEPFTILRIPYNSRT